jgi:hypothetical protein
MEQTYGQHQEKQVIEALAVIQELGLCGFVKNFDNNQTGFIWSSDPRVTQIGNSLTFQGHSGCSFACTLRGVQSILLENENNNNNNNNNNLPYPPIICEKV